MDHSSQNRINRKKYIASQLKKKYESLTVNDRECFRLPNKEVIHVDSMGGEYDAIVIEYAENIQAARKNLFEDGDLFYMDEMSEKEMLQAIMEEIENE